MQRLRSRKLSWSYVSFTLAVIMAMLLAACGAPAAQQGGSQEQASNAESAPAASDAAAAAPAVEGLKEVPRNRTFRLMLGGREGQHIDYELWNPYAVGANHQTGSNIMY